MTETKTNTKKFTQTDVLALGWTRRMIDELLPQPELKKNPHRRHGAPMKLWREDTVREAMQTEEFKAALEKANVRRQSAKKAVATKTAKLTDEMERIAASITVTILSPTELYQNTLDNQAEVSRERMIDHMDYLERHGLDFTHEYQQYDIKYFIAPTPDDDATLKRWTVNYIRHKLVSYDSNLDKLHGKTGKDDGYKAFKTAVLKKIAQAYPDYAGECERQADAVGTEGGDIC
ncbi:MAG: hypothetical protein LUG52_10200 [Clostridia bacterium]|nr:hypothetical protein [Clostridia bacterium]